MNEPEEWGYEAKFSVRTDFLDTTFRRSRQQREGESYEDFCMETHREMLRIVEKLRDQFAPPIARDYAAPTSSSPMPIIDKKWDQFEVDLDNAQTSEEFESLVSQHPAFPGRFLPIINAKRQSFKS